MLLETAFIVSHVRICDGDYVSANSLTQDEDEDRLGENAEAMVAAGKVQNLCKATCDFNTVNSISEK